MFLRNPGFFMLLSFPYGLLRFFHLRSHACSSLDLCFLLFSNELTFLFRLPNPLTFFFCLPNDHNQKMFPRLACTWDPRRTKQSDWSDSFPREYFFFLEVLKLFSRNFVFPFIAAFSRADASSGSDRDQPQLFIHYSPSEVFFFFFLVCSFFFPSHRSPSGLTPQGRAFSLLIPCGNCIF